MCILLRVHSSCTQTKIVSFVRVPYENTSAIVNLAVSCTVIPDEQSREDSMCKLVSTDTHVEMSESALANRCLVSAL